MEGEVAVATSAVPAEKIKSLGICHIICQDLILLFSMSFHKRLKNLINIILTLCISWFARVGKVIFKNTIPPQNICFDV